MRLQNGQSVVFFGDSITRGNFGSNYIDIIERLLSEHPRSANIRLINAGRDGDTVDGLKHRAQSDVLAYKPDWVVVLIGINDVLNASVSIAGLSMESSGERQSTHHMIEHFTSSYLSLIDILKGPVKNLAICTTTVIEGSMGLSVEEKLALVNDTIRSISQVKNCGLIDLHLAFKKRVVELREEGKHAEFLLTVDGVHLNKRGAQLVAETMFQFFSNDDTG